MEVCSTTLPQTVIPAIMSDTRYESHLEERRSFYKKRAEKAYKILKNVSGIISPKTAGAFYVSVVFKNGGLNDSQKLEIKKPKLENLWKKNEKAAWRRTKDSSIT